MSKAGIERLRESLAQKGDGAAPGIPERNARPSLGDGVSRGELLQNASITAQVCVKGGVELATCFNAKTTEEALDFASKATRRLMEDAHGFIQEVMTGRRRKTTKKEPKP